VNSEKVRDMGGYHPPAKKMRGIDAGFAGRNEPQFRVP